MRWAWPLSSTASPPGRGDRPPGKPPTPEPIPRAFGYQFTDNGTLSWLLRQVALQALHLGGERSGHAGPDVSLEYQEDPGRPRCHGVNGLLDHAHHLVPLTLDRGEHGIGVVR